MKRVFLGMAALAVTALLAGVAAAQEKDKKDGRPPFGGGFRSPFMKALDTNEDGELSADELKNATEALKKLDKNNDGKLSAEELRPTFGGPGGPGGQGFGDPKAM